MANLFYIELCYTGASHKNVPTSYKTSDSTTAKEAGECETDAPSTMAGSQSDPSFKPNASTGQQSKPMSHISGVRRDLSRCDSVATDVVHLPKYGVKTDRETELGEVFQKLYFKFDI
jgi:hypothetical protein